MAALKKEAGDSGINNYIKKFAEYVVANILGAFR